jgi:uncharacterized protein (TIGR02145 family)
LGSSVSLGNVSWAVGAKFMQMEIDLGNGFIDLGTQQMLSVPYALYSRSVKLNVSSVGDTLFVGDGSFVIVPGISAANDFGGNGTTGTTLHTCGAPNGHNPDLTYGTMTDQEGNTYKTIVIGTQEWMAENLNTSIYRNGDTIPIGLTVSDWANSINIQLGVSAFYDNDSIYACPHGRLYSWFVCVDSRQLCPSGWHVPNDEEWEIIVSYLGGDDMAGNMMKTSSEIYWSGESVTGSNESGFSGTAAGRRFYEGFDDSYGEYAYWWSISESATNFSWSRSVSSLNSTINRISQYKHSGLSVRCLRD